jgi:hypothetical protein
MAECGATRHDVGAMIEKLDVGYGFIPCAHDDPERTHFWEDKWRLESECIWANKPRPECAKAQWRKPVKIPEGKELVPAGEIETSDMEYWGREMPPGWNKNHYSLNKKCGDYQHVAAFIRDKKPAPANPALDWNKPLQTRDGRKARLLGKLNGRPDSGYLVAVADEHGVETLLIGEEVINVPQRIKREVWLNVYPDRASDNANVSPWRTRELANRYSYDNRIACVKVSIDCAVGEGLES